MRPLVTLVTPVYNAMPWLRDYLDCVAAQTWRPLELILVDDGSSDDSGECMRQSADMLAAAGVETRLLFCPHGGQAAAMNAALPLISGTFFTWCDADDLLTPDSVEKKALWLMEHPQAGMVRSNGTVLDADTGTVLEESARAADRADQNVFEALLTDRTYCYAGCYMVRTELFFACYPEKQIPESPEGQNLQLLLPPASRTVCGYLDEKLHTYCRRSGSHSSRKRSYQDMLRRIENFTVLQKEILKYCDCDRSRCEQQIALVERRAKAALVYSAVQQARKDLGK
ncbi:MAG: glycosyltransferase family 2 protein [Ruminococcaceae bacterium]|nr:glycosyltransferase family 2 protein [Oscillospiraceae bacterium]